MKCFRVPSGGAANIYTASLYMAPPMGFRMWAASSSGRMPEGYPFPAFRLHCGERFRYEYDFTADWKLDIRLEGALPFDSKRALPSCIDGRRAAPPEDCAGAWGYLKRLDWHRSHLPIDGMLIMVEAMRRIFDFDGAPPRYRRSRQIERSGRSRES